MMMRKRSIVIVLLLVLIAGISDNAHAQRKKKKITEKEVSIYDIDTLIKPIPRQTGLWHTKIDKAQDGADVVDGRVDHYVDASDDSAISILLTKALIKDVDHIQIMIENMPPIGRDSSDTREKVYALRALNGMLAKYNASINMDPYAVKKMVTNMHDLIIAKNEGKAMEFIKDNVNEHTLNNVRELFESSTQERFYIYSEMGKQEPKMMIKRLAEFANEPYADDVIGSAAKVLPNEIFNYASSTNPVLSNAVKRSKDPLVQAIVKIAQESKVPLKAMPFLNDIYTGKKTIAQIDAIAADADLFYQNLVRLKLEGVTLGSETYTSELQYRGLKYVREMNDLHEEKDPVRFKCIDKFNPYTLYFIMVYGQDEIYTSSFLGTFRRMLERMKPMKGDELLDSVRYDKFRTFIRMCAGYNTLGTFLATIEPEKKNELMRNFIAGLEQGKDDDLEDAVDVADAFGSITDTALAAFLENEVKLNYENAYSKARSKKGVIIYGLLATLFEGMKEIKDSSAAAEQSDKLGLPPINQVRYSSLVNDSGIVYQQFFFYGDEDGRNSYASFLGNFKDGKWKIAKQKDWTTITSIKGKPVVIYANNPIPEPGDEEAQKALRKYLEDTGIKPVIIVHRGHSYHLPITMDNLIRETKVVMLGSCGGYHNLGKVLDNAPSAHIISSKQTGAMAINEPIIKTINDQLLAGNDIDWIRVWRGLDGYFAGKGKLKELFDDYIPPHKNLGAIFIKAYRRMFNSGDEE
jgi:hypothetical protein